MTAGSYNNLNVFVLDINGLPVPGATVTLFVQNGDKYQEIGSVTTKGLAHSHPQFEIPSSFERAKIRVEKLFQQNTRYEDTQIVDTKCRNVKFVVEAPVSVPANPMVLFVHGLGGQPAKTWGRFGDLIKDDPLLNEIYTVDYYTFPTSLFYIPILTKTVKIQTLASGLRTAIDDTFKKFDDFTLVCHSMGGLIARKYLIDEYKRKKVTKVRRLLLYASPNTGANLAGISKYVSIMNGQIKQMCKDADLVESINEDWFLLKIADKLRIRYVVGGLDSVVDIRSASGFYGNIDVKTVADGTHINIVKPKDERDLRYTILRNFLLEDN